MFCPCWERDGRREGKGNERFKNKINFKKKLGMFIRGMKLNADFFVNMTIHQISEVFNLPIDKEVAVNAAVNKYNVKVFNLKTCTSHHWY